MNNNELHQIIILLIISTFIFGIIALYQTGHRDGIEQATEYMQQNPNPTNQ